MGVGALTPPVSAVKAERTLTDAEKIQYFDLLEAKKVIDTQLQTVEKESNKKKK